MIGKEIGKMGKEEEEVTVKLKENGLKISRKTIRVYKRSESGGI